jgi:magnesium-transporting ATPase (P-type)
MTASGRSDITGVGYAPEGRAEQAGAECPKARCVCELQAVLRGGSLAGNAQLQQDDTGAWGIQGDPTEAAFLVAERKLAVGTSGEPAPAWKERFERIGEIPFTSQRKMMSVLVVDHADGDAHVLFTKGAPDVLLGIAPTPAGAWPRWRSMPPAGAGAGRRGGDDRRRAAHAGRGAPHAGARAQVPPMRGGGRARAGPGVPRHRGHHRPAAPKRRRAIAQARRPASA